MPQFNLNMEMAKKPPKPIFTSKNDEWGTPQEFFDKLDREFRFTLDPCANKKRPLKKGMVCYDIHDDGLAKSWGGGTSFHQSPL